MVPVAVALIFAVTGSAPAESTTTQPVCTPLKQIYSRDNWQDPHPAEGENACPGNAEKWKQRFFLWRHYRQVATYRGFNEGDPYLKWLSVPAYIVSCETQGYSGRGRWAASNPSGAVGPYQLLGWNAPYPATTPREKIRNHEIAASLSLSAWSCA